MIESIAKFYVAEIACVLDSLSSIKIVHRKLKLDNILRTGDGHIKLTDFGLSTVLINGHDSKPCGAPLIRSPQTIRGKPYTVATDWYALCMVMYQLVVGYDPFIKPGCQHSQHEQCTKECLHRKIVVAAGSYNMGLSSSRPIRSSQPFSAHSLCIKNFGIQDFVSLVRVGGFSKSCQFANEKRTSRPFPVFRGSHGSPMVLEPQLGRPEGPNMSHTGLYMENADKATVTITQELVSIDWFYPYCLT
ncbi:hypothetical protein CROQUDRAFT_107698 [Cronartium quercuum f. sp. fusiforme G11]|uniref:Protein kinase domain-containing protein n=1 Tax=Cronartium quercuum f. sp. fusiforme G11 TaxID=708437 RepID=A0A9P6NK45_9BASI|nr:hypothetical protein CROQUDRAFT_107698 [Cronartium quercuum f. sp. fusiforme G11]